MYYVIKGGDIIIGNPFGFYGCDTEKERFYPVIDGEYANGGYGPSSTGVSFKTATRACTYVELRNRGRSHSDALDIAKAIPEI